MTRVRSYTVSGMTCDHCVAAVTEEIAHLDGVSAVDVALRPGADSTVTVTSDSPLADERVREAVDEAGYEVTGVLS